MKKTRTLVMLPMMTTDLNAGPSSVVGTICNQTETCAKAD